VDIPESSSRVEWKEFDSGGGFSYISTFPIRISTRKILRRRPTIFTIAYSAYSYKDKIAGDPGRPALIDPCKKEDQTMSRNAIFWILAVVITLSAAVYQRRTGPTYPLRGSVQLAGETYAYELIRSHGGNGDAVVEMKIPSPQVQGALLYKRYKTQDPWTEIPLTRRGEMLQGELPQQPPAGKLEYYLRLSSDDDVATVPEDRDAVIRFKGDVPVWALAPHVLLMFLAMLISTRAGLEAIPSNGKPRKLAYWATGLLFCGGMIFGPIVQKYAFGEFWTGAPWGWDLTDNKTLIAMVGWAVAFVASLRGRTARLPILIASILLLVIFSIPHSMMGSELNYSTGEIGSAQIK
jgi:hypothetical protein